MFRSLCLVLVFLALALAQTEVRCPYCVDKECGPDGTGGSCGSCPVGQSCWRGTCICDRNCDGRECGADACGTMCGECLAGQVCQDGICVGDCTPQCVRPDGSLRTCGWDRCGRNDRCGTCPEGCGYKCRDGTCECVPSCENKHCGPDGCGGSCGECAQDAFCQGENDPFPGQCYFDCYLDFRVEVREEQTELLILGQCDVSITGPLGFSAPNEVYPGSTPGFFTVEITDSKFGDYSFSVSCPGYQASFETHTVNTNGQLVTLHVDYLPIQIEVRDEATDQLVSSATIQISGTGYSSTVSWVSPIYTWSHAGFMTYTFVTSSSGYDTRTATATVTLETTLITLYLGQQGITLLVEECATGNSVSSATITVAGQTINWSGSRMWVPPNGFTTYSFTTASPGYQTNIQSFQVTESTTQVTLCVNFAPIPVRITDCRNSNTQITGASVAVSSSSYSSYSFSFSYTSGYTWTPVGFGTYSFSATANNYDDTTYTASVSASTTEIAFCMNPGIRCGDGICNGEENSFSCADCGQIRGVISLAVGQKDQLGNITISVWGAPTNPALYMRRGETVPDADFKITSDSKGYFGITKLSFDSEADLSPGTFTRRFYFSLTGVFVDRTGGNDAQLPLLPLWWNYELTNRLYQGGSYVGTNGCPNLYFYMTPEFDYTDALVRIILSWGVQISTPSTSIPDLDLVVAGPVNPDSITIFGSGVVNFDNKDEHSSTVALPYAKLITDSAQGYGPEVFDFYGTGNSEEIGFSSTYAAGAEANAYEIWVDKPNSSPNQDAIGSRIADTNAFIIVYQSRQSGLNEQILFDDRTGVEYAYGFANTDQWNAIPTDATMWHIIDISLAANGIVYQGFPGETDGSRAEQPGCKYSYVSSGYQATKVMPCGHVAARGANPEYCPFTLTYPQTKRTVA